MASFTGASPSSSLTGMSHPKVVDLLAKIAAGDKPSHIDLSNCGLQEIPEQIYDLGDAVELLNLGGNQLSDLPDSIARLTKLRILFFAQNNFRCIPRILGTLSSLYMLSFKSNHIETIHPDALSPSVGWLILTDNHITQLPASIGNLKHLRKCMLAGNLLTSLPSEMAQCQELELLRIAANNLKVVDLPAWLWKLPKLTWLALAGNDESGLQLHRGGAHGDGSDSGSGSAGGSASSAGGCDSSAGDSPDDGIPAVLWSDLLIQEKLGEGASGVIYKAIWSSCNVAPITLGSATMDTKIPGSGLGQGAGPGSVGAGTGQQLGEEKAPLEVAVKLFKGGKTSDGLPEDEMKAAQAAGGHPCSFQVLGRVINAPDGQQGLVFPLIPPEYTILGGPPSFESVTRDVYPNNQRFSAAKVLRILKGIASVCQHLHARGISHGDLYAHNILVNTQGDPLLSDFGAASFYPLPTIPPHNNPNPASSSGQTHPLAQTSDNSLKSVQSNTPLQSHSLQSNSIPAQGVQSNNQHLVEFAHAMENFEVRAFGCLIDDLASRINNTGIDANNDQENDNNPVTAKLLEKLRLLQNDCCSPISTNRPRFCDIVDRLNN